PFEFNYDYQRADLEVRGPSFYQFDRSAANETIYTSSGMAAISALLLSSVRLMRDADILVLPGSYGETLELIESHARQLRLVRLKSSPGEVESRAGRLRILLFDSCAPMAAFEATLHCARPQLDLVIFDTTCFSSGSGRIRRVLRWARRWELPIVLVRSHTKRDSLGLEYGRLGSAVFVTCEEHVATAKQERLENLAREMRNAVRLFGGAALPAHFPPYVGTKAYRALTARRGHFAQWQTNGALFCLRAPGLVRGAAFRPRTLFRRCCGTKWLEPWSAGSRCIRSKSFAALHEWACMGKSWRGAKFEFFGLLRSANVMDPRWRHLSARSPHALPITALASVA